MNEYKNRNFIKKCPSCDNNISYNEIIFPVINDRGGWIINCNKCNKLSFTKVINPEESFIKKGGEFLIKWDDELGNLQTALREGSVSENVEELKDGLLTIKPIEKEDKTFDLSTNPIYICPHCSENLEKTSYQKLCQDFDLIKSRHNEYMNVYYKGRYGEPGYIVIMLQIDCKCEFNTNSLFYTKFYGNGRFPNSPDYFLLSEVYGTSMEKHLNGLFSKTDCMHILEKLIIRWNLFSNLIYIVTPFIGHQWLDNSEIVGLWKWMVNYLDPNKTKFVTRTATFNKYKKASMELGVDIELLKSYDLSDPVIDQFTRKTDFHAKFYGGLKLSKSEILSGSFNLVEGTSIENLTFKEYETNRFLDNYIKKMKIPAPIISPISGEVLFVYRKTDTNEMRAIVEYYDKEFEEIPNKYRM